MKVQDTFISVIFKITDLYRTDTLNVIITCSPVIVDVKYKYAQCKVYTLCHIAEIYSLLKYNVMLY